MYRARPRSVTARWRWSLPAPAAFTMATANPADFLSLDHRVGRIAPGRSASLLVITSACHIAGCWLEGVEQPSPDRDR